jgi:hypothetical protein
MRVRISCELKGLVTYARGGFSAMDVRLRWSMTIAALADIIEPL